MVCMDLFVAALAIGLGFRFAQYAMELLTEFIEVPLSELKKPRIDDIIAKTKSRKEH